MQILKIGFIILLILHGLIHLMGFVKAFHIATVNPLSQSISKFNGVLWLLTGFVFLFSVPLPRCDHRHLRAEAWLDKKTRPPSPAHGVCCSNHTGPKSAFLFPPRAPPNPSLSPPIYLVAECITMSAPSSSGRVSTGVAKVLSTPSSSCLLYTSPSPRDRTRSRMPSSA